VEHPKPNPKLELELEPNPSSAVQKPVELEPNPSSAVQEEVWLMGPMEEVISSTRKTHRVQNTVVPARSTAQRKA
jgi:hypothetical protein